MWRGESDTNSYYSHYIIFVEKVIIQIFVNLCSSPVTQTVIPIRMGIVWAAHVIGLKKIGIGHDRWHYLTWKRRPWKLSSSVLHSSCSCSQCLITKSLKLNHLVLINWAWILYSPLAINRHLAPVWTKPNQRKLHFKKSLLSKMGKLHFLKLYQ